MRQCHHLLRVEAYLGAIATISACNGKRVTNSAICARTNVTLTSGLPLGPGGKWSMKSPHWLPWVNQLAGIARLPVRLLLAWLNFAKLGTSTPLRRLTKQCPHSKEIIMKRLMLVGAAALVLASLMPDDASAQRGRGGGSGMRVGGGGGGVRAAAIGGGYRGAGIAGGGYAIRSAGIAPGVGIGRGGYAIRSASIARGGVWRGRRGWGIPLVAGLAAAGAYGYYADASYGYSSYGYSDDQCLAWNGYGWVSVCRPADWNYGNNSMW